MRPPYFAWSNTNWRTIDSRVPILRVRWSSSMSHQDDGANSSRIASATSVRVIVPSKSVKTASLDGIGCLHARLTSRAFAPGLEVRTLVFRQAIDSDSQATEFQLSDLQIEVRGYRIHAGFELRGMVRQIGRRDRLDGKAHVHDLHRMALARRDVQES